MSGREKGISREDFERALVGRKITGIRWEREFSLSDPHLGLSALEFDNGLEIEIRDASGLFVTWRHGPPDEESPKY